MFTKNSSGAHVFCYENPREFVRYALRGLFEREVDTELQVGSFAHPIERRHFPAVCEAINDLPSRSLSATCLLGEAADFADFVALLAPRRAARLQLIIRSWCARRQRYVYPPLDALAPALAAPRLRALSLFVCDDGPTAGFSAALVRSRVEELLIRRWAAGKRIFSTHHAAMNAQLPVVHGLDVAVKPVEDVSPPENPNEPVVTDLRRTVERLRVALRASPGEAVPHDK
eukprot:gnl/Chilomastix_cuspidata/2869.p1 GENE.gnl/Chilomastix_cuspidata/2869~~gnl/Chilomastix_cuspidata/2869.p1  ORF type:complete len:229 (-),score=33.48 gnl/Chilomastix_cuspidata/2869:10-696(-)